ncbi:hypothetical protein [Streptomyces sp. CBMA152]|uniref:hypothetical protein n=1 Tax=Streptomyces sp. CBMA152 TaxID=1896312 RepID=UPI001661245D|nr:hypothetical protein [Streptomyces sp. CBMA152]MBD0743019.1 hypothetical protein [Streptomyces sp. CBMA152]
MTTSTLPQTLTTAVLTNPVPLAVGEQAQLDVIISNGGQQDVYCDQIVVTLPVGSLAQDLVHTHERINTTAHDTSGTWTFTQIQEGAVEGIPADEEHRFHGKATPTSGSEKAIAAAGLRLHLDNLQINSQVGSATVGVHAHIRRPGDSTWTWEHTHHRLDKYPARPDLVPVTNLRIVKGGPDSKEVITQINAGQEFTLKWDGPGDKVAYILYGAPQGPKEFLGSQHSYTVEGGIKRDATFTLLARAQEVGGHQKETYLATAVIVTDPEFDKLTVDGVIEAKDVAAREKLLVGSTNFGDMNKGDVRVGGKLNLSAGLGVTGDVSVDGDIEMKVGDDVRGKFGRSKSFDGVMLHSAFHVTGTLYGYDKTLTIGDMAKFEEPVTAGKGLTVKGTADLERLLTVSGLVNHWLSTADGETKHYTALNDGFVIMRRSSNGSSWQKVAVSVTNDSDKKDAPGHYYWQNNGGETGDEESWSTVTVPICAGERFSLWGIGAGGQASARFLSFSDRWPVKEGG